jgi:hypothetical protein
MLIIRCRLSRLALRPASGADHADEVIIRAEEAGKYLTSFMRAE